MSEQSKMQGMNEQRLAEIIEAYGALSQRWPEAERNAANELLARSPEARALLAQAVELDRLLDTVPLEAAPSTALVERLLAARPRAGLVPAKRMASRSSIWKALWPYGSPVVPTGALAFSMLLGIVVGALAQTQASDATAAVAQEDSEQLVSLALAETNYPEEWQP